MTSIHGRSRHPGPITLIAVCAISACMVTAGLWAITSSATGCTPASTAKAREDLDSVAAQLQDAKTSAETDAAAQQQHIAAAKAAIETANADGNADDRATAEAALAAATKALERATKTAQTASTWQARVQQGLDALQQASTPDGGIDPAKAVQVGAGFIPPPWNVPVSILAGGVVSWIIQQVRRGGVNDANKNADSIITGIEAAKNKDPDLRAKLEKNEGVILKEMTDAAYQRVKSLKLAT